MRERKHLQDLAAFYDLNEYRRLQAWFYERGVQANYSMRKRSWFFMAVGRKNGPTVVICWCGIEAFVSMLDEPKTTLRAIAAKGGNVAKRHANSRN